MLQKKNVQKFVKDVRKDMMKYLYPGTGYNWNPKGKRKNLRESSTLAKVKKFHKAFYRPENLVLIITGKIKRKLLFKKLNEIEESILKKRLKCPIKPFHNPWHKPLKKPDIKKTILKKMTFFSKNETKGWN